MAISFAQEFLILGPRVGYSTILRYWKHKDAYKRDANVKDVRLDLGVAATFFAKRLLQSGDFNQALEPQATTQRLICWICATESEDDLSSRSSVSQRHSAVAPHVW